MKHLLLLLLFAILLQQTVIAQDYQVVMSTGISYEGDPLSFGVPNINEILNHNSTSDVSEWQSLPFPFEFYGEPVSGYVASKNGFISFSEADSNSSASANTALPTTDGPNNAIYAFWEELTLVSAGSDVSSWTYGVAPNRVHLIRWFALTPENTDRTIYFAIRLYECGNFDIVHSAGTPDTQLTGTIGCENATGSAGTMVAGSPAINFPSLGVFDFLDDAVYTFYAAEYDIELTQLNIPTRVLLGEYELSGTLTNKGTTAINAFHLNYSVNGGPVQTMEVTGVNIPPVGGTYSFVHDIPWMTTPSGELSAICVYADQLNGSNLDQKPCDDQFCKDVFTYSGTSGNRTVLIEEFSGAWCGHCPDGEVELEEILAEHPNDVVALAYHEGDDMDTNAGYDVSELVGVQAYPNASINRVFSSSQGNIAVGRSLWASMVAAQLDRYTPAEVSIEHEYNPANRVLRVTLTADFVDDAYGDMRFALAITEDDVTGTGIGYDQVNFYNSTFGHPFAGMGNPIVGYPHQRVVRAMPSGAFGTAGIIPNIANVGDQYSKEILFIVPSSWNEDKLSLIAMLAYHNESPREREIINVVKEKLMSGPTPVKEVSAAMTEALLFPNPARDRLNFSFTLAQDTPASMLIYDAMGRLVSNLGVQDYSAGHHELDYDVSNLSPGIYYLKMQSVIGVIYSGKFVVLR
ncbi:Omp28-related outer membrane protein [Lewinella cohaerens]|uniref:T9SS type A sorting domain-containing protein n=1 Tax=Lewinella cohaerens TaxID=70995 RepID=UPI000362B798|nr:Omp28-related outer membrane protein [Lewinella cohaerens]